MTKVKGMKGLSAIIIFVSLLFIGLKYFGFWIEGFSGAFILLNTAVMGVSLFIMLLILIIQTKRKTFLISFFIGLIAIITVVFAPVEHVIEKLKSPIVLFGYCEHTVTVVSLTLRQDRSFEYNGGAFMKREMYYGNYQINDDTLVLSFAEKHPETIKEKLVFSEKGLLEIGDTIKHRHLFRISRNIIHPRRSLE